MIRANGGQVSIESNGWSSHGKRVQTQYSDDYVEFHMTIPKGRTYGNEAIYSSY